MVSLEKARYIFNKCFTTDFREKREGSIAVGALRRFVHGIVVYKAYVIPLPLIEVISLTLLGLLLTENIMHIAHINWIKKFAEFNLSYPALLFSILVVKNRDDLIYITESIDIWWSYPFLKKHTEMLKKISKDWLTRFSRAYYRFMILGFICIFFQPIGKYIWNGRSDLKDLMLFKCWSPFPLDKTWGLVMILVLEIAVLFFLFFLYSTIMTYMVSMTILFYYQTHLIGVAFATIEERVWKMVSLRTETTNGLYLTYVEILQQEISNCARNYQNLYIYLKKMCKIFNITTNTLYYTGMFQLITSGLHIVAKKTNSLMLFQAVMLMTSIIVNQYLNTFITETLNEATARLRISVYYCNWYNMPKKCQINIHLMQTLVSYSPKLTTFLGAKCDKEFFSKVINASYCYFSTLYSMRIDRNESL